MVNGRDNSSKESKIQDLLDKLCDLAMAWRGQVENRALIEAEYKKTYEQLSSLGWNEGIDIDCQLPEENMPPDYFQQHPFLPTKGTWPFSWRTSKEVEEIKKARSSRKKSKS